MKKRDSNMELLRIVAMIMIITFQIVYYSVYPQLNSGDTLLFAEPVYYKKLIPLYLISPWGRVGNALFLLISGYYLIGKESGVNIIKITRKLMLQQGFAALLLMIVPTVLYNILKEHAIPLYNYDVINDMAWFVGYYYCIAAIGYLFLCDYLKKTDKTKYSYLLLVLLALSQFGWPGGRINSIAKGLRILLAGLFFFAFGGYIHKYNPFGRIRTWVLFFMLAVMNMLMIESSYNLEVWNIQNYPGEGAFEHELFVFAEYHLFIVVLGVIIFEIFRRINIGSHTAINYIGASTLFMYLIHDNKFMRYLWNKQEWITPLYYEPAEFLTKLFLTTLLVCLGGVMIYTIYRLLGWIGAKMGRS